MSYASSSVSIEACSSGNLVFGAPIGAPSFEFQLKHAQAVTKRVDSFVHPKFRSYAIFGDVDAVSEPHL